MLRHNLEMTEKIKADDRWLKTDNSQSFLPEIIKFIGV